MIEKIPEKYAGRLVEMMRRDDFALHFYESFEDKKTVRISGGILPEDVADPIAYLKENDLIEPQNAAVLETFLNKIDEAVKNGTEQHGLFVDISVKPAKEAARYIPCRLHALFLLDDDGKITDVHYTLRPFSPKEQFEREVMRTFSSDKNPRIYAARCASVIAANPDKEIAFIQFDVERFKIINETYGVEKGDDLLQFINDTLGLVCSQEQPYCRLTADVFMIVTTFETREKLIEFIRMVEKNLNGYGGMQYRLKFGVCIVEDRTAHTRKHGDNASLARQLIKSSAVENIRFYEKDMKASLKKMQTIENEMDKALAEGQFVMYLQPKHSISSGRIIGAESLARWIHPEKGMISPADFIPVFEENGFIFKLDRFIWEEAAKRIRYWIDNGIAPVPVSVNISRKYLKTANIINELGLLISKYDIPISMLELEITESIDGEGVEEIVREMKKAGFTMLMDDFGSGYSSLNMLKSTPFDVLKIDRAFLSEFMESTRGRKIIEHTISMSQDIGLDIIAEGVETLEQAKFLSACGCDSAQGFFYSKPIPVMEFDKRLLEINGRAAD